MSIRHDEPEAAAAILTYFVEHPEAADTLEGLAHWRLAERGPQWTNEQVAKALEWLVARGHLKEILKPYADRIYSMREENLAEAKRYLERRDTPET